MATKALHALKEFAAGLPDESSQTAFAAGAEPVYAFCERYKGGLIDNSTGIVCRLIERFLAVERFYPDDRSELLGVTKLSAHHSDNGKTLQARSPSASAATTAILLTPPFPRAGGVESLADRAQGVGDPLTVGLRRRPHEGGPDDALEQWERRHSSLPLLTPPSIPLTGRPDDA